MLLALPLACTATPDPPAAPSGARSDAIYFVMVDRFADGRPDPPGTTDPDDPQAWHGGDLQGLRGRLDHIAELGFGGVWLSPITRTRTEPIGQWGAYHGYWMLEPDAVEPRFGTRGELEALAGELRSRRMRLYLDLVVNHVGYDSPLLTEHPDWFHRRGDIQRWDDPVERVTHDVHGLPDLAQENPAVAAWLVDAARGWATLADGFRIDAVRHVHPGFLAELATAVDRPGFQLLGEVFDGNPGALGKRMREDRLDAVFDFPLMYGLHQSGICEPSASYDRLVPQLFTERHLPDREPGPLARLVTLLDNHDTPRLASICADPGAALGFLFGLRGTPSVIWGTELPVAAKHEPATRPSMNWDAPMPLAPVLAALNQLRARWPALRDGEQWIHTVGPDAIAVARATPDQAVLVVHHRTEQPLALDATEAWLVRGSTVTRWRGEPFAGTLLAALPAPLPRPETGPTVLTATVSLGEGEILKVTGSAPELGAWDPDAAPILDGSLSLHLPPGTALAAKLVRVGPGGATWSQAPDVVVHAGRAATLPWRD